MDALRPTIQGYVTALTTGLATMPITIQNLMQYALNIETEISAPFTGIYADAPLSGSGTSSDHLKIPRATAAISGYIHSDDFAAFKSKQAGSNILTALSGLTYVSGTPFVRMTGASSFSLDTNTYLTDITGTELDNIFTLNGFLKRTGTATYSTDTTVTTQGNTFNGVSQLLQLNSSGQIPALDAHLLTGLTQSQIAGLTVNDSPTFNDLNLPITTALGAGIIYQNSQRLIHTFNPTTSTNNLFIGYQSGNLSISHTTGNEGTGNTCIGFQTAYSLTTGYYNNIIGSGAGYSLTTGFSNNLQGLAAGYALISGYRNVAIGESALRYCTIGHDNLAVGYRAIFSDATSTNIIGNVAYGGNALYSCKGNYNTGIGYNAGYNNVGTLNVFIGYDAGYYETGSNKLFIDNAVRASEADGRLKALIYGIFAATTANQYLYFNSNIQVAEYLSFLNGGIIAREKRRTVTTNTTIDETDSILEVTTAGVTLTLRTAVGIDGKCYTVDNQSTGDIYVNTTSSQTIENELTQTIPSDCCMDVYGDNANWRIR